MSFEKSLRWASGVAGIAALLGCGEAKDPSAGTSATTTIATATAQASASGSASIEAPRAHVPPPSREGGALARAAEGDALFLADEDHAAVRRFALPDPSAPATSREMPGRPAQVLPMGGRVLVTIRDPGMLLVLRSSGEQALSEEARVVVPPDAWGVAVTPDEKTALVTSAWAHAVTAVDLQQNKVLWSIDVAREPRAVVIAPDGNTAYVTHLIGETLTRIDDLRGTPKVSRVPLTRQDPKAAKKPKPKVEPAPRGGSLAYSAVLSPDGTRLFVPRHEVGGLGPTRWAGSPTVTVVWTRDDKLLVPEPTPYYQPAKWQSEFFSQLGVKGVGLSSFWVGRAAVYRKSTKSLLVASEATDAIVEMDGLSLAPSEQPLHVFRTGRHYEEQARAAKQGAAPTGIALSADEQTAYVYCRATYDLVTVPLTDEAASPALARQTVFGPKPEAPASSAKAPASATGTPSVKATATAIATATGSVGGATSASATSKPKEPPRAPPPDPLRFQRFAEDPLGEDVSVGRRLFYTAMDPDVTDQASCATCHPEGREDAFVWTEVNDGFLSIPRIDFWTVSGAARQTPMIAGRVSPEGPYGWLAESPNLKSRIIASFGLHRWHAETIFRSEEVQREDTKPGDPRRRHRGEHLAMFLRQGLYPPPATARVSKEVLARGEALFKDEKVGCAGCHEPKTDFTNRAAVILSPSPHAAPGFVEQNSDGTDRKPAYKTPSLLYVGGTAPYYHDGSAESLEQLIDENGARMGKTAHLSKDDRAALVAYLKTLGTGPLTDDKVPVPVTPAPRGEAPQVTLPPPLPMPGSPSNSGAPSGSAGPPEVPVTKRPTYADWAASESFPLTRTVPSCSARKLREYVRVRCEGWFDDAYAAAGPTEGSQFWEGKVVEQGLFAVFPLRPGERRLLFMDQTTGLGKYGALAVPGRVISVTWLPGEEPIIDID